MRHVSCCPWEEGREVAMGFRVGKRVLIQVFILASHIILTRQRISNLKIDMDG